MVSLCDEAGRKRPQPFGSAAMTYHELGLAVIPCGGEDGKKPLVPWSSFKDKQPSLNLIERWIERYGWANIAVITGEASGVTVIDNDNPEKSMFDIQQIFGESPIAVKTPRGGCHLYYKFSHEKNVVDAVKKIDIRGHGGYVIAPPSYSFALNGAYSFIEGSFLDLRDLTCLSNPDVQRSEETQSGIISQGKRNDVLFRYLINIAGECESLDILKNQAEEYNKIHFCPVLDKDEVLNVAKSVWKYKEKGQIYKPGEHHISVNIGKYRSMMFSYPRAFILFFDLLGCHQNYRDSFAIAPKAYARQRCGWSEETVRRAIRTLLKCNVLEIVYKGGKKPGDVSLYCFKGV